jgi:hypothetical protein
METNLAQIVAQVSKKIGRPRRRTCTEPFRPFGMIAGKMAHEPAEQAATPP